MKILFVTSECAPFEKLLMSGQRTVFGNLTKGAEIRDLLAK